jgi:hypothetical protein
VRTLQSPDQTERRAATWYDTTEVRVDSTSSRTAARHLYAVDWNAIGRARTSRSMTGPALEQSASSFNSSAWVHTDRGRLEWLGADRGAQHRGHLQRGPQRPVPRGAGTTSGISLARAPARRRTTPSARRSPTPTRSPAPGT